MTDPNNIQDIRSTVIDLYNQGYYIWEIALKLGITEHEVDGILGRL